MCNLGAFKKRVNIPKSKAIIAYRAWYKEKSGTLRSPIWSNDVWVVGKEVRSDYPPSTENLNGLYCFKTLTALRHHVISWSTMNTLGQVKIWGEMIEFSNGFRAEYASIVKFVPYDARDEVKSKPTKKMKTGPKSRIVKKKPVTKKKVKKNAAKRTVVREGAAKRTSRNRS